ncbi:hypothetical protein CALCODRAFT_484274 [Calocera cornea HHB12733]|uniref:Uncharacterized protein n=1 Tax=Calocera cornea HHB12733 TaxID=1353952 RepID=A0A165F2N5_9BASI|nr:hypothetical protein CALCODRAFT_484274 [Calocera cornea HHB12733]
MARDKHVAQSPKKKKSTAPSKLSDWPIVKSLSNQGAFVIREAKREEGRMQLDITYFYRKKAPAESKAKAALDLTKGSGATIQEAIPVDDE